MPNQSGSEKDPFFKGNAPQSRDKNKGFFKGNFGKDAKKNNWNSGKNFDGGMKNRVDHVRGVLGNNKSRGSKSNGGDSKMDTRLREIKDGKIEKGEKHFDKKLYRMKKYSNKYKLEKWENQRRKEVLKKYYKEMDKDPMAGKYKQFDFDEEQVGSDEMDKRIHYVVNPDRLEEMKEKFGKDKKTKDKIKPFKKVKDELQRLKAEKQAAREAKLKAAQEKEEAIAKYKVKKADRFKKLSKKTRTGQPVMKDRMQMLFESIQKSM